MPDGSVGQVTVVPLGTVDGSTPGVGFTGLDGPTGLVGSLGSFGLVGTFGLVGSTG